MLAGRPSTTTDGESVPRGGPGKASSSCARPSRQVWHIAVAAVAVIASLAVSSSPGTAGAGDPIDLFGEPETSRPRDRKSADKPAPQRPLLAPMDGRMPHATAAEPSHSLPPAAHEAPPPGYGMPYPRDDGREPAGNSLGTVPADNTVAREPLPYGPIGPGESIERSTLDPVVAGEDSGLGHDDWRGLTVAEVEQLLSGLELPPRSPTLHRLWMRLLAANADPVAGGAEGQQLTALRAEALRRSGMPDTARETLARLPSSNDPVVRLLSARSTLELGNRASGCADIKALLATSGELPQRVKGEAIVLAGYCAAADGNLPGAGMAAEQARELGVGDEAGPLLLEALAHGAPAPLTEGHKVSLIGYRMRQVAGPVEISSLVSIAEPALLSVLATGSDGDASSRLSAAEAAAAANVIGAEALAEAYRKHGRDAAAGPLPADGPALRAEHFKAIETERTPQRLTRQIRTLLDSARRAGLYRHALRIVERPARDVAPAPEIGWFAETGTEIALASGDLERARQWVAAGGSYGQSQSGDLTHWLALIDIADQKLAGPHGATLASVEQMALTGRFDPGLLHRLATVLDALQMHVPVPLWEAASRAPQPVGGHLPETGLLTALQDASKRKEIGRTVLLAMKALGPAGGEGAHLIVLGDAIRALKRAGLETEARSLAVEALFGGWPRASS